MKAPAFDYVVAESVTHACALLASNGEGARLLSGGQSLMPALNMRLMAPELLIDLGNLAALRDIRTESGLLHIGALARHVDVLRSPLVAAHAPMLTRAVAHVAHPAIRNRGTIGGNLAHADPASELPACMLALDATIIVQGAAGERRIAAAEFFTGMFSTALEADEVLIGVVIPTSNARNVWTFDELARRSGDYAIVGLCTHALRTDNPATFTDVKLAFFAVGDRPTLAHNAAACIEGSRLDDAAISAACNALSQDLAAQSDLQASEGTRMHLARVMLARALRDWTSELKQ
jgi:carbon-monoxide dehydrogenase medium subunit